MLKKTSLFFSFSFLLVSYQVCYAYSSFAKDKEAQVFDIITPAKNVITRVIGEKIETVNFRVIPSVNGLESFNIEAKNGSLHIEGSSTVALCYAFNTYLKEACHSMITWSGKHLNIPASWPDYKKKEIVSPYQFRYYLNVVTFGYTTPYWDWERWEQEIDWMALHGINMTLAPIASEAIAERIWLKLGLTTQEINEFFTGPAYLPWHRMGNLNGWDGHLTDSWHKQQLQLQHKIIDRMRELGIKPVIPTFAGFVPKAFMEKNPDIKVKQLKWGGFPEKYNAFVIAPDSLFFEKIGKLYIQEWEKEFGKNIYYLSDSFNEMELPFDDEESKYKLLEEYGEAIYKSIVAGNPDAIWVTQGWTFGYQHKFWDKPSLQALLRNVPNDKMIIIDLANEYPKWVWHTDLTWKVQEGFYGKNWIFSYTPNFGGKTPLTGELPLYASYSIQALQSQYRNNLIGFGFAPEGIDNNEVVYELLADMGWQNKEMDLKNWIANYCIAKYGGYPNKMEKAWELLLQSVYGSLYSYPRFTWQTVVPDQRRNSKIDTSDKFLQGVKLFLDCSDELKKSPLYCSDAIELSALYLSAKADLYYKKALEADSLNKKSEAQKALNKTVDILLVVDKLLASHPTHKLENWVNYTHKQATNDAEKMKYEADAKRLITTWGGFQEDYAARVWSGLIRDYYIPRIQIYFSDKRSSLDDWEEKWINTPWKLQVKPFSNPIEEAKEYIKQLK